MNEWTNEWRQHKLLIPESPFDDSRTSRSVSMESKIWGEKNLKVGTMRIWRQFRHMVQNVRWPCFGWRRHSNAEQSLASRVESPASSLFSSSPYRAWAIFQRYRCDHISPLCKTIWWLPLASRHLWVFEIWTPQGQDHLDCSLYPPQVTGT